MAVNLTRLFALFGVFCALATTAGTVDLDDVKKWAENAGTELSQFFNGATKFEELQEAYNQNLRSAQLSVTKKDGFAIVNDMKSVLEGVLQKKIKSIKNLAKNIQGLRSNYTYEDDPTDFDFYNAKDLPEDFPLEEDPTFSKQIGINKNNSVVHIPTDVYSGGVTIRNTIKWTNGLDPYFKENEKEDPTLLWQYFGSSDGVYRVYPGFKWPDPSDTDIFDHRRRGWYIQGSSSPKDIVLLLDLSGSMAGQKLAILKLAAMSLLETLQENDFVNIVVVYADEGNENDNTVKPYMVCQVMPEGKIEKDKNEDCSSHLLQATQQNKKYLQHFVPRAKARGIAAISKGFVKAIEVLKTSRAEGNFTSDCAQAIILFTDGIEESQAEETRKTLEKNNGNKEIRVFTYLVGSKNATDSSLKDISNKYRGCFFRIKTMSDVREKVLEYVNVLSRPLAFSLGGSVPDPSWTPIYLDKLGLGLMITLDAPVFNKSENKELLGVVGTDVALPQLEDSVPGSEVGVNGYGFAINNNGFVLFHPKLDKKKDPPNIALDQLEYNAPGSKELMQKMIDRLAGNMSLKTRFLSEEKHRLSWSEDVHYFFSPVENTSFSAAVAIPKTSMYSLSASGFTGSDADADKFLASSDKNEIVKVAPWKICPGITPADLDKIAVYEPAYPTADDIRKDTNLQNNCNETKLKNLLFDANLTKVVAAKHWNVGTKGIEDLFVATHGGIMRWLNSSDITLGRDYIKEQFYRQAAQYADKADNDNEIIVFSAPYKAPNDQGINGTVTATAPVIVSGHKVVAAVAGLRVKQDDFTQLLLDAVGRNNCNITNGCSSYFIDDDGFVVASNKELDGTEVGKFFGVLEGAVMNYFVNRSLFEKLTLKSVQEECEKPKQESSNARRLLNPLFAVTSYVQFWTQTVFWSLAQFNIYSFFSRGGVAMAEGGEENMIPCSKEFKFYKQDLEKNQDGGQPPCESCERRPFVYIARVPNTNLQLAIVKETCDCEDKQLTTKPKNLLEDMPSHSNVFYRKPPKLTPRCDDTIAGQGKPPCALASFSSPGSVTMVLLLTLALFIPYNDNWR